MIFLEKHHWKNSDFIPTERERQTTAVGIWGAASIRVPQGSGCGEEEESWALPVVRHLGTHGPQVKWYEPRFGHQVAEVASACSGVRVSLPGSPWSTLAGRGAFTKRHMLSALPLGGSWEGAS